MNKKKSLTTKNRRFGNQSYVHKSGLLPRRRKFRQLFFVGLITLVGTILIFTQLVVAKTFCENMLFQGNFKKLLSEYCEAPNQLYGHYKQIKLSEPLVSIGKGKKLARSAAIAYQKMKKAAAQDGINLVPISGYRNQAEQHQLFYSVARQRRQIIRERARVSAPPGYSEHQTGYAVDLNSLEQSFAMTNTYQWLKVNAPKYGFEESFPHNNTQGLMWEPWHFRFRGSPEARKTFCWLPRRNYKFNSQR